MPASSSGTRGRGFLVVLDGVGVGDAPDAAEFGDSGSDSIGNTARHLGKLELPNLGRMGLGHLTAIPGTHPIRARSAPGARSPRSRPARTARPATGKCAVW
jgi:phosphopentomutase